MSTNMDEDDWTHALAVFRACLPRRGRKAEDDRRFLRGASFLHRRERSLARSAGALRPLEQRVETLRSLEQGRRLRGVLRHARLDEFPRASHSDVRLDHCARACVGGRSKRGQEEQALGRSRGGFTTKIHAKSDASGDIIAFDLTGGEAFDGRPFDILLDIGPDIQPRAVICDKGYASKANRDAARARGIAPVIPHKANEKNKPAFFGPRPHRAGRRTAQALQARRPTLRKDRSKLQIHRLLRRRPMLDQIRPHNLAFRLIYGAFTSVYKRLGAPNSLVLRPREAASKGAPRDTNEVTNWTILRDAMFYIAPQDEAMGFGVTKAATWRPSPWGSRAPSPGSARGRRASARGP